MIVRNEQILYDTMYTIERRFVKITIINVSSLWLVCVLVTAIHATFNDAGSKNIDSVRSKQYEYGRYHKGMEAGKVYSNQRYDMMYVTF